MVSDARGVEVECAGLGGDVVGEALFVENDWIGDDCVLLRRWDGGYMRDQYCQMGEEEEGDDGGHVLCVCVSE